MLATQTVVQECEHYLSSSSLSDAAFPTAVESYCPSRARFAAGELKTAEKANGSKVGHELQPLA